MKILNSQKCLFHSFFVSSFVSLLINRQNYLRISRSRLNKLLILRNGHTENYGGLYVDVMEVQSQQRGTLPEGKKFY